MRAPTRLTVWAVAIACISLPGIAQYDRDSSGVPKTTRNAPPPEARIDINHATEDQLLEVPGMTRSWAGRIIRFRPYHVKGDLMEMGVVPDYFFDRIKDFVIARHEKL
jgi:DNA uptake protein ComE-like DNA-binding protein